MVCALYLPLDAPERQRMNGAIRAAGIGLDLLAEAEVDALKVAGRWVSGGRIHPAWPDPAMTPRNRLVHDIVAGAVRQLTLRDLLGTRESAREAMDAHLHAALEPRNVLATALASESQELREIAYRAPASLLGREDD